MLGCWAFALPTLLVASPAAAYLRATVDDEPGGQPLRWEAAELTFLFSTDAEPPPSPDVLSAYRAALATWSLAGGCSSLALRDGGLAPGSASLLVDGEADGQNRVVLRASTWPPEVGPETLALTSFVYDRGTGAMLEADVDVNAVDFAFSTMTPPLAEHDDLQNTLTHELGHALGFGHSDDPRAAMFGSAPLGETTKRALGDDDLDALCDVYPNGRPRRSASSCSIGLVASPPSGLTLLGLLAALLGATASLRRCRRAA